MGFRLRALSVCRNETKIERQFSALRDILDKAGEAG